MGTLGSNTFQINGTHDLKKRLHRYAICFHDDFAGSPSRSTLVIWFRVVDGIAHSAIIHWKHLGITDWSQFWISFWSALFAGAIDSLLIGFIVGVMILVFQWKTDERRLRHKCEQEVATFLGPSLTVSTPFHYGKPPQLDCYYHQPTEQYCRGCELHHRRWQSSGN